MTMMSEGREVERCAVAVRHAASYVASSLSPRLGPRHPGA